jgi:hypothetical protein
MNLKLHQRSQPMGPVNRSRKLDSHELKPNEKAHKVVMASLRRPEERSIKLNWPLFSAPLTPFPYERP